MHVLHVVGSSDLGIEENHVFQLATALASRGVRVDVACPRAGPFSDRLRRAGIEPIVLPLLAPRPDEEFELSWPAVQGLAEVCRSLRPDLVHTHLDPAAFHGLLAAREAGVRAVIHTAHTFKARPAEVLLTRLGGCHLIALTRSFAAQLERAGVPRQQLTVVHNGVPPLRQSATGGRPLPPMNGIVVGSFVSVPDLLLRAAAAWHGRDRRPVDLVLTHAPPLGVGDRDDAPHRGVRALHGLVGRLRPALLLHGHVHPFGEQASDQLLGRTVVRNVVGRHVFDITPARGYTEVRAGNRISEI